MMFCGDAQLYVEEVANGANQFMAKYVCLQKKWYWFNQFIMVWLLRVAFLILETVFVLRMQQPIVMRSW